MFGFNTFSDIFDDAIFNLFGSDLNDLFSNPSNTTCSKRTFRLNDHVATTICKPSKDGKKVEEFYVDGKRVKELPDWAVEGLRNTKALAWRPSIFEPIGCNNKLPDSIVSGTEIPHVDVIHKKDGGMFLKFTLAGVAEDRIEITAEDNFLLVTVKPSTVEDDVEGVYLQRGIKNNEGQLWKRIFVDPKKYDINSLNYTYENGMLKIDIAKSAEPEKNKLVFKKATVLEAPTEETKEDTSAEVKEKKGLFSKKEKDDKKAE